MRYVALGYALASIFADADGNKDKQRLDRAHARASEKTGEDRRTYINNNGISKWSPIKDKLTAALGNKCWYTEAEVIGASLTIDHYRPKCDYWFLAFNAHNYRVACPFANSPKHNEDHGCAGGKGDAFPLLDPAKKAANTESLDDEEPIILDPCRVDDCKLVAFQPDGRPVIHPDFADERDAVRRVEESKVLLNLDHPDFNSKREQLCRDITMDVKLVEALPAGTAETNELISQLRTKLSAESAFSSAARFYMSVHRNLDWVETLVTGT